MIPLLLKLAQFFRFTGTLLASLCVRITSYTVPVLVYHAFKCVAPTQRFLSLSSNSTGICQHLRKAVILRFLLHSITLVPLPLKLLEHHGSKIRRTWNLEYYGTEIRALGKLVVDNVTKDRAIVCLRDKTGQTDNDTYLSRLSSHMPYNLPPSWNEL